MTEDRYSLAAVARMFRVAPKKIKQRAYDGQMPYRIDGYGRMYFLREDLLPHLEELTKRNNRI